MADYSREGAQPHGGHELASASTSIHRDAEKAPLPPFDPYAPVREDSIGRFWDEARQVNEWTDTGGEEFMQAAHALRVAELQHGIHVAESVARTHANLAENAQQLAERLREVARNVSHVGLTAEAPARTREF